MRLTMHTDYALRLLMLLAVEPARIHTIEEVARRYAISRNHLMKVALRLTQAGFTVSLRGRHGGLQLAKPAEATEDSFTLVECFDAKRNGCVITSSCGLKGPLEEALLAFLATLDRYSLADLIKSPRASRGLRRLLGTAAADPA
jgi:Rrf2 family nitric oxide-sensitive transcriptional repressor